MKLRRLVALSPSLLSLVAPLGAQRPEDQPLPPPPTEQVAFKFVFGPGPVADGGTRVRAGEAEARCWDDKLTIEFTGARPALPAMEIVKDDTVPTIFVAGDSTVGDPRCGPGGNWPTQLCQFLKPEVAVCNSADGAPEQRRHGRPLGPAPCGSLPPGRTCRSSTSGP